MLWLEPVLLITVRLHESSLLVEWWRNPHRERPQWFPRQGLSWEYPSYLVNIHPTSRSTVHLITVTKLQLMHVTSSEPEKPFTGGAERGRTVWALCYKSKKSNRHPCSKHSSKQLWIQLDGSQTKTKSKPNNSSSGIPNVVSMQSWESNPTGRQGSSWAKHSNLPFWNTLA